VNDDSGICQISEEKAGYLNHVWTTLPLLISFSYLIFISFFLFLFIYLFIYLF